jgi:hypothetical protein
VVVVKGKGVLGVWPWCGAGASIVVTCSSRDTLNNAGAAVRSLILFLTYSNHHHQPHPMEPPNHFPNGTRVWVFGHQGILYGTVVRTARMADGTQLVEIEVDGEDPSKPRTLPVCVVHQMSK